MIGPAVDVPFPTLVTFKYSLSTNKISLGLIDEIPLKGMIVVVIPIFPDKVWVIPENANGYWTSSSTLIKHLVFLSFIVNLWALPSPRDVKVTPVPLWDAAVVIATLKVSSVILIAYTVDGKTSVALVIIALVPTPTIVEFGV